ncbi:MAG: hypothetical protein QUS09_07570, partial [Methanotrichaceae archaeon]|nr:hypothetical protein [Methanotrichaceae archaeon]
IKDMSWRSRKYYATGDGEITGLNREMTTVSQIRDGIDGIVGQIAEDPSSRGEETGNTAA